MTRIAAPPRPLLLIERLDIALPSGADRPLAVSGASLSLDRGEVVCIVGESGSGKSVLASAIAGLLPGADLRIAGGRLLFDGQDVTLMSEAHLRRLRGARIGYVFQEPMTALNPLLTIGRQIAEALEAHGHPAPPERIAELLSVVRLPRPDTIGRRYPHELSGGQRQRVAIAIAMACDPDLLIADEPTTALDVTTQAEILKLILDLRASRGLAVMFITHDFGVVGDIADRIVVMQDGRIVEAGDCRDVLDAPRDPYTRRLLAAVPSLTAERARPESNRPTVLKLEAVRKTHARRRRLLARGEAPVAALNGVDLVLRAGETLALVGESGSGKTTLGHVIAGLTERDAGRFQLLGEDIDKAADLFAPERRAAVQMVFQDPQSSLNPRHSVRRILTEPVLLQGLSKADAEVRMISLLSKVGLDSAAAGRRPHAFSGGQRQRIGLARALMLRPKLLIADEPVSALDVSVQAQVLELLEELREELGLAILFITHDLRVASKVADRIAVMQHGEIVETGTTVDILRQPCSPYARALLAAVPGRERAATGAGGTRLQPACPSTSVPIGLASEAPFPEATRP